MSSDSDLDRAIVEVQQALERFRLATRSESWVVVEGQPAPVTGESSASVPAPLAEGPPQDASARGSSAPRTPPRRPDPSTFSPNTRASTLAAFPVCPQHCYDLCAGRGCLRNKGPKGPGEQACGLRKSSKTGGRPRSPHPPCRSSLRFTWFFGILRTLTAQGFLPLGPSGLQSVTSVPLRPSATPFPPLQRQRFTATPQVAPCLLRNDFDSGCRFEDCVWSGRYTVCLEVALGFDPVLSRAGGFLLATPASLLPSLRANAAESSPNALVGPFHPVSVPGMEEDELGETPAGVDVEAVLIDMEEGALGLMELFDTDLTYEAFVQEAPHVMPLPEGLHTAAMAWIEGESSERMAFYEAHAPASPAAPKRAVAKPKRPSMAQLSEQVAAIADPRPSRSGEDCRREAKCKRGKGSGCGSRCGASPSEALSSCRWGPACPWTSGSCKSPSRTSTGEPQGAGAVPRRRRRAPVSMAPARGRATRKEARRRGREETRRRHP